jgi:uncharacterized membrane protein YhaH (DUF805 family)
MNGMRTKTRLGVVLCIGFVLWSTSARGDTFYKYRDKSTGRDVFVNRLDQIPRKYRDQAKIVIESADLPRTGTEEPSEGPDESATGEPSAAPAATQPSRGTGADLRRALSGKSLWKDGPDIPASMVDAKLRRAGTSTLTEPERSQLRHLLSTIFVLSMVAGLFAFVVWVVMIVTALRDGRNGWALLIFLLAPLAYVYLFVHAGKGRWAFKLICASGMLSPALVALGGVWRFYGWLHAVVQARGGHM